MFSLNINIRLLSSTFEKDNDAENDTIPTLNNIQDDGANGSPIFICCITLIGVSILWSHLLELIKHST